MAGRAARRGYVWEDRFRDNLLRDYPDAFVYKIMDTHSIEGLLGKLKAAHMQYKNFLVPKVPGDFITVIDGKTRWIECKSTANKTSFPFGNISPHQLQFASDIEGAGGEYIFAIRRDEKQNQQAWLVSATEMFKMINDSSPRKSIKWPIFETYDIIKLKNRVKGTSSFSFEGVLI